MSDRDRVRSAIAIMDQAPPAAWVREMNEHYHRTGAYRAKDIRRVMGSQTEGVKIASDAKTAACELARQ